MIELGRVLLVDDNEATCTLIRAILRRAFEVEWATDGAEAIEKLKANRYLAVLLDLKMPIVDGYGVLDFLAAEKPEMLPRVVVVTAALTRTELSRTEQYGVGAVIRKPFDVEELFAAVCSCAGIEPSRASRPEMLCAPVMFLLADILRTRFPFN